MRQTIDRHARGEGGAEDFELDRVAIVGRIKGAWFVARIVIDGDGHAHAVLGRRDFGSERAARRTFADAH